MVLIHLKNHDNDQFIYETTRDTPVESVIENLVRLCNQRLRLDRAATCLEDLIKKGTLKPEETRGLAEGEDPSNPPFPGFQYRPDEHHYRSGWAVPDDLGSRVYETIENARNLVHKSRAEKRIPLRPEQIEEAISLMKGGLMMAYPGYHGLPPWEPITTLLENEDVTPFAGSDTVYEPENASLWFAGKEVLKGKPLGNFVKGNENTKIIAKLTKTGAGAPVREPLVDPDTQKQMIAWYHKKQEEEKKMLGVQEDEYLNSAWADPKALKKQLHGAGEINWRPR